MTRQIVVTIFPDGRLAFQGDDLPDFAELLELIGPQAIDEALAEIGLDVGINSHLCG
jgi:hypothetical protein